MQSPPVYVGIIFLAGLFEMWAAAVLCDRVGWICGNGSEGGYFSWAVAVGVISSVLCLIMTVLFFAAPAKADQGNPVVSVILFLLWLFGVIFCTFMQPFNSPCGFNEVTTSASWTSMTSVHSYSYFGSANGYFGTWIAFFASVKYMLESVPQCRSTFEQAQAAASQWILAPLLIFSIILMAQASVSCSLGWSCTGLEGWAVACGVISAVICLLLMFVQQLQPCAKYIYILLFVMWLAAVATLTYQYADYTTGRRTVSRRSTCTCTHVSGSGATDQWCATNCFHDPVYCPSSHCSCTYNNNHINNCVNYGTGNRRRRTANDAVSSMGIFAVAGNGFFSTWAAFFCSFLLVYVSFVGGDMGFTSPKVFVATILFGSIFELWAAATLCHHNSNSCGGQVAWAVAVGAISTFCCLVMTVLFCAAEASAMQVNKFFAVFIFILWALGAGVCTFSAPFRSACGSYGTATTAYDSGTANGYFATWICCLAAFYYLYVAIPELEEANTRASVKAGPMIKLLLFASLVEMIQAAVDCSSRYAGCSGAEGFAVAIGVISIILCLLIKFVAQVQPGVKYIAFVLVLIWLAAVCTMTFEYSGYTSFGIFSYAGNGFFSTWGACFAACVLFYTEAFGGALVFDSGASGTESAVTARTETHVSTTKEYEGSV